MHDHEQPCEMSVELGGIYDLLLFILLMLYGTLYFILFWLYLRSTFCVYYVPLAYFRAIITQLALWLPQRLLLFAIIIHFFLLFSLLLGFFR
ncbi:hypothetical protein BDV27DRAFT_39300 [Aspergillus caelatus]|uniref:Uncharacterized protein n=1 Tax=Aspergillus caelatus TaxID=61420 RepID=A0A5N6ZW86_9EURO|nr:uncharacterized protein BDV27DRAFT_39300 [Aspergillus caelatus]KAE8360530.1 hypothetical protein BDV27DRAFT_39300 [Aspergillus caelatus]